MTVAEVYGSVSVKSECQLCLSGHQKRLISHKGKVVHWFPMFGEESHRPCLDYDSECRHAAEPLGFYAFAWKPVRRRNGRWAWLRWVELHADGSVTLGNRAF